MIKTPTFKEAHRLYKMGLAIHWLHPRSKRPIESKWTTGPRKSWEYLTETYIDGLNVGVRLGQPSQIGKNFLAVVDVDVKSKDERHRKEALQAAAKLLGGAECPTVSSGRGNGSRHYYCVTEKSFKTFNPAASEERVKVHMPSKSPSKKERAELSLAEIKEGIRIANAWEISLYSDGRQVVLPPSIHPDSGKPYFWSSHLTGKDRLPLIQFEIPDSDDDSDDVDSMDFTNRGGQKGREQENVNDFEESAVQLEWLEISDKTKAAIIHGTGVNDRSAYLLVATTALISAGCNKNEILSVLTNRKYHLGQVAYEHAQTDSRKRAAKWLWNYTVKRVMAERDAQAVFLKAAKIEPVKILDDDKAKEQAEKIESETDWRQYLEKTKDGQTRNTLNNCKTIVTNVCGQKGIVGRNEFAANDFYLVDTPWKSKKGNAVTDSDIHRIKFFCSERYGVEFGDNTINQTLMEIADDNRFHPVRRWLKSLEWDGKPRINTWLKDHAEAVGPREYLQAVSRKVLVAMVKRVFEPGCKFDHVLILEGEQGAGKSTLLRKLAGDWFSDATLNIGDKDAILTMQSKWLIELGELSSLNRTEVESMKAFVSQATDRIRAPYGKRVEEFPRQCVFIGSTNQDEYLKDETGNRRFWPVKCGKIDFDGVAEIRDQLFAEAYQVYKKGEPLYLDSDALELLARAEQHKRGEIDEWLPTVRDLVMADGFSIHGFEMREVSKRMDQLGANRLTPWDQKRISKCLRVLGFEKFQEPKGQRRKLWRAGKSFAHGEPQNLGFGTADSGSSKSPYIEDFC